MNQGHFLHHLYDRFIQKNALEHSGLSQDLEVLTPEKKKQLAQDLLQEGEKLLDKKDFSAFEKFDIACHLDPLNPDLWYKHAVFLFDYGITQEFQEKIFLLAGKYLKQATQLSPDVFSYFYQWAVVLYTLGAETEEHHYFEEAKKKFQKAILLIQGQNKLTLAKFYWQYGLLWLKVADHSGEAVDVRMAIQSLRTSLAHQVKIPAEFWHDFGQAHLQMALLINENKLYFQAIEFFSRALSLSKTFADSYFATAQAYAQLYLNTLDEQYFVKANEYFSQYTHLVETEEEAWLEWAKLLGESGKLNKDTKKLQLSVEKCAEAYRCNAKSFFIIAQWVESLSLLGALLNRLDFITEAEEKIIKIIEQHPDFPELWYAYGCCFKAFSLYYNDTSYEELAIEKFQTGLSLDRTYAELWYALASSYHRLGNMLDDPDLFDRASKFYQRALQLKPGFPGFTFDYAMALISLSELTKDPATLEQAISLFEAMLPTQKEAILHHPEWLFYYAKSLDLLGDIMDEEVHYTKAIDLFHHVLLLDPDFPKIHYHIALCYAHLAEIAFDTKFFDRALQLFQLAVNQDQEDDKIYLDWGLTLISYALQTDSNPEAFFVEAEKKLLQSGQLGNQHTYYHLACLHSILQRLEESFYFLQQAHIADILPPIEELLQDDWLENLRSTEAFSRFIAQLERKENLADER